MTGKTTQAGHIFAALDLANLFRRAIGVLPLDVLPVANAKPQEATECVLALAFNAGCAIDYDKSGEYGYPEDDEEFSRGGAVTFSTSHGEHTAESLARQFAEESGVEVIEDDRATTWSVPLRDEITEIALAFDNRELADLIAAEESVELTDLDEAVLEQRAF